MGTDSIAPSVLSMAVRIGVAIEATGSSVCSRRAICSMSGCRGYQARADPARLSRARRLEACHRCIAARLFWALRTPGPLRVATALGTFWWPFGAATNFDRWSQYSCGAGSWLGASSPEDDMLALCGRAVSGATRRCQRAGGRAAGRGGGWVCKRTLAGPTLLIGNCFTYL